MSLSIPTNSQSTHALDAHAKTLLTNNQQLEAQPAIFEYFIDPFCDEKEQEIERTTVLCSKSQREILENDTPEVCFINAQNIFNSFLIVPRKPLEKKLFIQNLIFCYKLLEKSTNSESILCQEAYTQAGEVRNLIASHASDIENELISTSELDWYRKGHEKKIFTSSLKLAKILIKTPQGEDEANTIFEELAEYNLAEAQTQRAEFILREFENEKLNSQDPKIQKATKFLENACKQKYIPAYFDFSILAMQQKDLYDQKFIKNILLEGIKAGDARCYILLSNIYEEENEFKIAIQFAERALSEGVEEANFKLGILYKDYPDKSDPKKALEYLKKSLPNEDGSFYYHMADCYEKLYFIDGNPDYIEKIFLNYKQSFFKNYSKSYDKIIRFISIKKDIFYIDYSFLILEKNNQYRNKKKVIQEEIFSILIILSESNIGRASYLLYEFHKERKNLKNAEFYLEKSYINNYPNSYLEKAKILCQKGKYIQALWFLQKKDVQDLEEAPEIFSKCYFYIRDFTKALSYLNEIWSKKKSNSIAFKLAYIYQKNNDLKNAKNYWRYLAEKDKIFYQFLYGKYLCSQNKNHDQIQGIKWLFTSAKNGLIKAQIMFLTLYFSDYQKNKDIIKIEDENINDFIKMIENIILQYFNTNRLLFIPEKPLTNIALFLINYFKISNNLSHIYYGKKILLHPSLVENLEDIVHEKFEPKELTKNLNTEFIKEIIYYLSEQFEIKNNKKCLWYYKKIFEGYRDYQALFKIGFLEIHGEFQDTPHDLCGLLKIKEAAKNYCTDALLYLAYQRTFRDNSSSEFKNRQGARYTICLFIISEFFKNGVFVLSNRENYHQMLVFAKQNYEQLNEDEKVVVKKQIPSLEQNFTQTKPVSLWDLLGISDKKPK